MRTVKKIAFAAMFLALSMVLPIITGGIPQIGNALAPMHLPVFLCGFICGGSYGALVGLIAPIMRSFIFQAPVIYPTGLAMSFELATYGLMSGLLFKLFHKNNKYLYLSLFLSMIIGRIIWGISRYIMAGLSGSVFNLSMFLAGAFTQAIPGIICNIILVPLIVMLFKKVK